MLRQIQKLINFKNFSQEFNLDPLSMSNFAFPLNASFGWQTLTYADNLKLRK